ncbi:MAG: AAA family ATPase [Pseudoalteromonas sp.]|uniref:AAA family ATPase n=1 Tax=Pseudoalteromonas sp. TaxID=53249 RepID=UPI001D712E61|nr:AAA family ATPase [Pseudoalteromonas sp.]NRA78769.1 AAA family ATPase [Pseudoalteromonas sp.]
MNKNNKELDEQIEHELTMQYIQENCHIDIDKKIEHPPVAFSYGTKEVETIDGLKHFPIPIGTYGNFSFIQAPPKSMKTFFVSLISSCYANSNCQYTGEMDSFRGDRHLIHFDTEQGEWHSQRVFRRVKQMNPNTDLKKFYHTFALRQVSYKERIDFIEYYLKNMVSEEKKVGLVIIDGVADLVSDANNLEESNLLVQKIMTWTTVYDCHIVTVIHSNWGSDKPTGHLGSFLEKKTETQIKLEFDNLTRAVVVSCKRSRNGAFKDFVFKLNERALPFIMPTIEEF